MYILHGLVDLLYFNRTTKDLMLTSKTAINGGIEVTTTEVDVKGGMGHKLIGRVFTDGMFNVNASDALFDFNYMKMALGGEVKIGGDMICSPEQVTITKANEITVTGTPVAWDGQYVGWYTKAGEDFANKITFNGKIAVANGLNIGDVVCVRYRTNDATLRQFIVPSTIIPDEVTLIMRAGLFSAGTKEFTASSKVGDVIIEVPRFIFSGSTTLSFDNTGASTTDLSGSALVNYDSTASCDENGYYAILKEVIPSRKKTDGLKALAVNHNGTSVKVGEKTTLDVIGIYENNRTGRVPNADLTFTSTDPTTASVVASGEVTGVKVGKTDIQIKVTDAPTIVGRADVNVIA